MAMSSGPGAKVKTERVRLLKGKCWEGVDYGPEHRDAPISVPSWQANEWYRQGIAVPADDNRRGRR